MVVRLPSKQEQSRFDPGYPLIVADGAMVGAACLYHEGCEFESHSAYEIKGMHVQGRRY